MNTRVIIITYYKASNYGAFFQAYSLMKILDNLGVKVKFYDYKTKPSVLSMIKALYGNIRRGQLFDKGYNRKMGKIIRKNARNEFQLARKKEKFDVAILGSDEIWNVRNNNASNDMAFFRKYKRANITISYAASAGDSNIQSFNHNRIKALKEVDRISIRDKNTEQLVRELGISSPQRVVDPTLLLDLYQDDHLKYNKELSGFKYVLVYSYGLNKDIKERILTFSHRKGYKIVATGSYCPWADFNPIPEPFEWLKLIKNAEYVFTTTFHGSIFSIIFEKQFVVLESSSKVSSLMEEFMLQDRILVDSIDACLARRIDYNDIRSLRNRRERESKDYIMQFFDGNTNI